MTETLTATTVTLTIPGCPAYSLSPNSRCHWAIKQRESRDVRQSVMAMLSWHRVLVPFTVPVRLHWTVYLPKGGKKRDLDNLLPCLKPAQDQLVSSGVIPGDSPRWIPTTPTVEQIPWSKHKGEPKIIVRIEEVR